MNRPRQRVARKAMSSLDVVICLAGALPVALALYLAAQYVLAMFYRLAGTVVGSPFP
jgi:hypothetical protein